MVCLFWDSVCNSWTVFSLNMRFQMLNKMFVVYMWEVSQVHQCLSIAFGFNIDLPYIVKWTSIMKTDILPYTMQIRLTFEDILLPEICQEEVRDPLENENCITLRIPCNLCAITSREAGIYSEHCSIWNRLRSSVWTKANQAVMPGEDSGGHFGRRYLKLRVSHLLNIVYIQQM